MHRIGVISDTHIPKRAKRLPDIIYKAFKDVDIIIHAGDFTTIECLNELNKIKKVYGVYGNIDIDKIKSTLPRRRMIDCGKFKIGLVHGDGRGKTTIKRAMDEFKDDNVNCIIFGHSHIPFLDYINGILMFNPGSACDKRRQDRYSIGILNIEENIKGNIIFYD